MPTWGGRSELPTPSGFALKLPMSIIEKQRNKQLLLEFLISGRPAYTHITAALRADTQDLNQWLAQQIELPHTVQQVARYYLRFTNGHATVRDFVAHCQAYFEPEDWEGIIYMNALNGGIAGAAPLPA